MAQTKANPTPPIELIARAVVRRGGSILLCRNVKHGYNYLPGGHIEPGEPAATALVREFHEETGVAVEVGELLVTAEVLFERKGTRYHELNLVFSATVKEGGVPRGTPPISSLEPDISFDWIDLDAIADKDLRPSIIKAWLLTGAEPSTGAWLSDTGRRA